MNECYRIFRCYCQLSIQQVSDATGISVKRLKAIEHGYAEPEHDEVTKLAALYNVSEANLEKSIEEQFPGIVNEPFDRTYFDSEEDRQLLKDRITSLSETEQKLILMLRCAEDRQDVFEKLMTVLLENRTDSTANN